jgi:hypothetical protein
MFFSPAEWREKKNIAAYSGKQMLINVVAAHAPTSANKSKK